MRRAGDPLALGAGIGAFGAVLAGLLGGLCCAGPVVAALLGAGGIVAAARLAPYRPYLLGAAGLLLVLGLWRSYRSASVCAPGQQCSVGTMRGVRALLWLSAALLFGSIFLWR